ncbi:MAG: hypothetical protein ABEJ99_05375 [Candidatus Nanohaloarchaea archaeon]
MPEEVETDRFGLKKLTTNQEVAISFALFVLGMLLVLSALYPLSQMYSLKMAFLGLVMIGTAYLFSIESIRELEEKDHFLSRTLMKNE